MLRGTEDARKAIIKRAALARVFGRESDVFFKILIDSLARG